MGWYWSFSRMPYGEPWRRHRGLFQKHFHARVVPSYAPIAALNALALLRGLLRAPDAYERHLRRNAAALVLKIAYGHDVAEEGEGEGDALVALAARATAALAHADIYGTYLVDYVPLRACPAPLCLCTCVSGRPLTAFVRVQ